MISCDPTAICAATEHGLLLVREMKVRGHWAQPGPGAGAGGAAATRVGHPGGALTPSTRANTDLEPRLWVS